MDAVRALLPRRMLEKTTKGRSLQLLTYTGTDAWPHETTFEGSDEDDVDIKITH